MSVQETISMATLVTSLSQSFKHVPPEAIHALLDCVLISTTVSPSTLIDLLIDDFPNLTKDAIKENKKSDSDSCSYIASLVAAFCFLLKKLGYNPHALQCFVWRVFVPLMEMVRAYDSVMLNKIVESFFDVVINTNSWDVLEANIIPFSLRSIGRSMGMLQNEESDVIKWVDDSVSDDPNSVPNDLHMEIDHFQTPLRPFPLPLACHLLSLVLEAALRSSQGTPAADLSTVGDCHRAKKLAVDLLWDICNMVERLLLQSVEHRSCAENFLLPAIFKAFDSDCSFKISISGQIKLCTRTFFLKRIWRCCTKLFSVGSLERRDAFSVLSLYLSFFSFKDMNESDLFEGEAAEFDITSDKKFWEEIKRGLVDNESLVRKQSLHILKKVLSISVGSQHESSNSEKKPKERSAAPGGMTKKDRWADKEARSLGVGTLYGSVESGLSSLQQWEAFLLLYEMLEEYGTHLVEAAWSNQITLLLQSYLSDDSCKDSTGKDISQTQLGFSGETVEVFSWLSVLWNRGFCHNNPLVRCMIMQSFLGIEWRKYRNLAKSVSESFILGPFMEGLNDPVHHKDFGVKGIYASRTIEGAVSFLRVYSSCLNAKERMNFLVNLASVAKKQSFGRAGLMGLAECIASSARVFCDNDQEVESLQGAFSDKFQEISSTCHYTEKEMTDFLDVLRFVIESSRQHFNPKYRVRVCQKLVEAAASVVDSCDVPLGMLLHFVAAIPQEFTDYNGPLRKVIQDWLLGCSGNGSCIETRLLNSLNEFPERFIYHHSIVCFDDEDLDAWENQAKKWARVLFLVIKGEQQLTPISVLIQSHGIHINTQQPEWVTTKFLVLILSVLLEIQKLQEGIADFRAKITSNVDVTTFDGMEERAIACAGAISDEFSNVFLSILGELNLFADASCSIFWSGAAQENGVIPSSVRGKLGGPSQRRLSVSVTASVLQAVTAVKVVASISSWCAQFRSDVRLNSTVAFVGRFLDNILSSNICISNVYNSENVSEIHLAAFEALDPALKTLVTLCSVEAFNVFKNEISLLTAKEGKPCLDSLVQSFLQNINNLLANGILARSRRAVLLNSKWLCLESLLSIIKRSFQMKLCQEKSDTVRSVLSDLVESLENAGEDSVLPMLRSVRLALEILSSQNLTSDGSSCNHVDAQMMWRLVNSCWILHVSCNKRRVAPIAALLSSVLHSSMFGNEDMHENDTEPGPLKWFVGKILEEGQKSPRTTRLAALHLTGLWLMYPGTIKYYIKELSLLTLYGSVAFDEDFEAELSDNNEARTEVSLLAKSPDPELTEVFINTELYARVSVAVLFDKLFMLADTGRSAGQDQGCQPALESGKLFLLDLLDSVVHNNDLSKELYKKYSGIHRRKIRAWQMICVLSRFVGDDIVAQVSESLHLCLYRNNLPAVRQYLETFAINIYLKFPSLVAEQLVPILQNYDMRPQALSSYVFIAANIILHASKSVQFQHMGELLPPIIPFLTSHHHSLRGFTQLLVHQVLFKVFPPVDSIASQTMPIESCSFDNLKFYLDKNPDCSRLRSSMIGYLDAYNPSRAITPAGIFVNRVEVNEFECVPTCLMDEVLSFLNDVREDLRCSMAKDIVTIRNESLKINENPNSAGTLPNSADKNLFQLSKDVPLDFQRKITLSKHEKDTTSGSLLGNKETYERLLEMEKEDELVNQLLRSRSDEVERLKAGRQSLILVASLIDRIPNLAGLARTCEVFKASGLAVADANIVHDKQFQLISVTAEKWVPIVEVPVNSMKQFLERKKREGFSILGLEQTANSITLDKFPFPKKTVLVLGREKEGIPVDIIHILDACIEIPQLGVVRSLNVHVSGAIALWEYTRQQRSQ